MNQEPGDPDRSTALADAIRELAAWSHELDWPSQPDDTRDRFTLLVYDTLAVTLAGAGTEENRALRTVWPSAGGTATALGQGRSPADRAAWLNGAAAVSLELDPASRVTRGHAPAQTMFAVLAAAEEHRADAAETWAALLVAHEVASRFGRACTLRPGLHPHGSWAATGAAAGVARVLGLTAPMIAEAIDVAGGLLLAAPFSVALDGGGARNQWAGFTNHAGLLAARVAATGQGRAPTGAMAEALHLALGRLDTAALTAGPDDRLALHTDFVKQHAACGYTHAVLDAALQLRAAGAVPVDLDRIERVIVGTNSTSAELAGLRADSRLAAMFSLPFMTAVALALGETGPAATSPAVRRDPVIRRLAGRVTVEVDPELEARMPLDRGARVTLVRTGAPDAVAAVPNARWDPRHAPATWDDVRGKARRLLGPLGVDAERLEHWVRDTAVTRGPLPALIDEFGAFGTPAEEPPAFGEQAGARSQESGTRSQE
ncbi:MmgE/PrpD family protein [Micromonospora sp. CB01531]|uniref:MmgE/PrpD family protein n=1 Tax=Micromonospora sp. CB01531 TaxID=1718947 RepID=UPI00093D0462|nr:MmgE/PrpD family protein [Micromonospora sp. CB01531]OKI63371.1 hypothetical protein A6A27_26470 [Micromonospora sp. CB01531]